MKHKKMLFIVVFFMVIGFAAVSTTLYINGITVINPNKDDFNVYFSDAIINDVQDKGVIKSDTVIEFYTTFESVGEEYVLDYEVTNGSKNYDAELEMVCTSSSEYLTLTNDFDDDSILSSLRSRSGRLSVKQTKSYAGDDLSVSIECVINANAIERTSLGIYNRSEITVEAFDKDNKNLNADAYQILGNDEEELMNSLIDTGYINDASDISAIIEVSSDYFEDIAVATFDVSSIASEGDKVVILHFNESKQEWEYISVEIVDSDGKITANFTSFSPVAFAVLKSDGSLEIKLVIIMYDANEGELAETVKTIIYHKAIGELPTPTREGYTFSGWYTDTTEGEEVREDTIIDEDITIYARWTASQYIVTYDGNGGTPSVASKTVTYDSTYGTLATATRTGYTFAGWYTETSGGTQITKDTKVNITSAQTLYAHWTVNNYSVSVKSGGNGTVSTSSLSIPYGGSKTFTVTPSSGYYLSSITCTGSYTVSGFTTGIDAISTQTVSVKSNAASTGTCTTNFAVICPYSVGQAWNYAAKGSSAETFTTPCTGNYKVELWGSSGKVNDYTISGSVGQGAYTAGNIDLTRSKVLYVYVGSPGYMGGGSGETSGGGSTDVRLVNGTWSNFDSLKSRIMVAAGGGGGVYNKHATLVATGHAGGLNGYSANATIANHDYTTGYSGSGATQTSGGATGIYGGSAYPYVSSMVGSFGIGGYDSNYYSSSGGGGGYYGGGHGRHPGGTWSGGGGGSSFISGHSGCNAISSSSTSTNIIHTGSSLHYSGYKFTNTKIVDGAGYSWTTVKGAYTGMPNASGGTMSGNSSDGYARFTLVSITNPN